MKKDINANTNKEKWFGCTNTKKVDFKARSSPRNKEKPFIMIKNSNY